MKYTRIRKRKDGEVTLDYVLSMTLGYIVIVEVIVLFFCLIIGQLNTDLFGSNFSNHLLVKIFSIVSAVFIIGISIYRFRLTFADEKNRLGATKLNTVENEKKHVLFLFNSEDAEVGRYYLGKKLQGKTPAELAEMKHMLCFFKSYNPKTNEWVPCVGLGNGDSLATKAVSI